jgi:hypothetical protein
LWSREKGIETWQNGARSLASFTFAGTRAARLAKHTRPVRSEPHAIVLAEIHWSAKGIVVLN